MKTTIMRLSALLGAAAFIACGGDSTGSNPSFTISADTAAPTTLGTEVAVHVLLTSTGGMTGPVTLAVAGLPASWGVTVPTGLTLTANGQIPTGIDIQIPSNGDAAASGQTVKIAATSGSINDTARTVVTVTDEFVVPIKIGANSAGGHWGALQNTTTHLRVGTMLSFRNDDTTSHIVHTNAHIPGILHGNIGLPQAPGTKFSQVVGGTGNDVVYCHAHTATDSLMFVVP